MELILTMMRMYCRLFHEGGGLSGLLSHTYLTPSYYVQQHSSYLNLPKQAPSITPTHVPSMEVPHSTCGWYVVQVHIANTWLGCVCIVGAQNTEAHPTSNTVVLNILALAGIEKINTEHHNTPTALHSSML